MEIEETLEEVDYRALASFRHALRRFLAFSAGAAREAGLEPQQYQALLAIKGEQGAFGPSVGELAEALLIRPHTAVELVDRLQTLGLVERRADPRDRRRVRLALTATAENILGQLAQAHLRELASIRPSLLALLHALDEAPSC